MPTALTSTASPVSLDDLELLKVTVLLGDDDLAALRRSGDVLADQVDDVLDVWYGFVADNPHLLAAFSDPTTGEPDQRYLERVRARFGQWIRDTAAARFDQAWLDHQHEIGLRHTRMKKNRTDDATAAEHIPLRYVLALLYPITATLRPFLAKKGDPPEQVEAMHTAWVKAVLLQVILWTQPYTKPSDF